MLGRKLTLFLFMVVVFFSFTLKTEDKHFGFESSNVVELYRGNVSRALVHSKSLKRPSCCIKCSSPPQLVRLTRESYQ